MISKSCNVTCFNARLLKTCPAEKEGFINVHLVARNIIELIKKIFGSLINLIVLSARYSWWCRLVKNRWSVLLRRLLKTCNLNQKFLIVRFIRNENNLRNNNFKSQINLSACSLSIDVLFYFEEWYMASHFLFNIPMIPISREGNRFHSFLLIVNNNVVSEIIGDAAEMIVDSRETLVC